MDHRCDVRCRARSSRALALVGVALVVVLASCSQEKRAVGEIRSTYESGDYRETIALCRHAIRNGVDAAGVYFYYGSALARLGRDYEADRKFRQAAIREPGMAVRAGRLFWELGERDARSGRLSRAADRMARAAELDPATDLGRYAFLVADRDYEAERFGVAAHRYREAIAAYPDSSVCERAYVRLAVALEKSGSPAASREALEVLLARYPRTRYKGKARWELATMTYADAEKQFALGDYESAIDLLEKIPGWTSNRTMLQKQRFLLGETYEAMGEFEQAFRQYRKVIGEDRGASGAIVLRAREKLNALREAGIQ